MISMNGPYLFLLVVVKNKDFISYKIYIANLQKCHNVYYFNWFAVITDHMFQNANFYLY